MQRRKIPSLSVKKQIKPIITITGMNFLSLLKKKTLTVDIDGYTSDEIVNALASGDVSLSRFAGHDILDEKGETVYRDFWGFSGAIGRRGAAGWRK